MGRTLQSPWQGGASHSEYSTYSPTGAMIADVDRSKLQSLKNRSPMSASRRQGKPGSSRRAHSAEVTSLR